MPGTERGGATAPGRAATPAAPGFGGAAGPAGLAGFGSAASTGATGGAGGVDLPGPPSAPTLALPKGGGALRGIGEKFGANPATGTVSLTVPIPAPSGRNGFAPQLTLAYDSGAGNGPYGLGWQLGLPAVSRKTDKGVPRYDDAAESDVYLLSGSEDLVPVTDETLHPDAAGWGTPRPGPVPEIERDGYAIRFYRPRLEGLYARIERWTHLGTGRIHWRTLTRDDVLTVYGPDDASCVSDGAGRIATWLVRFSYDDRGNAIAYEYVADDETGVPTRRSHERTRSRTARTRQRYLRRVRYGNKTPARDPEAWAPIDLADHDPADWMFSIVLDYGEHQLGAEAPDARGRVTAHLQPSAPWPVRPDPFSSYRSGFEVRTYRRCTRALTFHHFPAELGVDDCLVADVELRYADSPLASLLTRTVQHGYVRLPDGSYRQQARPALDLAYTPRPDAAALAARPIAELAAAEVSELAGALAGSHQWLDLDATGAPGLLVEQAGAWRFFPNHSPLTATARLGSASAVPTQPNAALAGGRATFVDLDADGRPELVDLRLGHRGFYHRTDDGWSAQQTLPSWPNVDPEDPGLRFADVTGDGLSDLVLTADRELHWSPSLGLGGFGAARTAPQALQEDRGARLLSTDADSATFLADMSGDGLADLVQIRNGHVSYCPGLGYARFGPPVVMDRSPWLTGPEAFDSARVRLVDADGSGPADLVYLGGAGAQLYVNEAGNAWAAPVRLPQLAAVDDPRAVQAVDLLGNGTSCLVWTPGRAGEDRRPLRYVSLYAAKPDLLAAVVNNLGAETHVRYAASTRFSLADARAGQPWVTRLPFPVQVLESVLTLDRVAGSAFATRYAYHHGFFDGVEREFRGFGLVEQWDTADLATLGDGIGTLTAADLAALSGDGAGAAANLSAHSDVPPVLVRSWFHTGAAVGDDPARDGLAAALSASGYRAPGTAEPAASLLPIGLDADERREAARALRGQPLRKETYARDGSVRDPHPYEVSIHAYVVRCRQRRGDNRHAVFDTHHHETITHAYERDPADPRTSQHLTLDVDAFGNVLSTAALGYGRRRPETGWGPELAARQTDRLTVWTQTSVTDLVEGPDGRRTPTAWQAEQAELTGLPAPTPGRLLSHAELRAAVAAAVTVPYEEDPPATAVGRRVTGLSRLTFRADDLTGPLPPGRQGVLGLVFQTRRLALTPGIVAAFDEPATQPGEVAALLAEGGYVSDADGHWLPSGRTLFAPETDADPAQELATARRHFFVPRRYRDPIHPDDPAADRVVTLDPYDLLVTGVVDALGNATTVGERALDPGQPLVRSGYDYRVLQPALMMGPNRNRSVVAFDTLGLVAATAALGAPEDDPQPGDSLAGVDLDLGPVDVQRWLAAAPGDPAALLGDASERILYDLDGYRRTAADPQPQPVVGYTVARETHVADLAPGQRSRLQQSLAYSDGFGRGLQDKKLVESATPGVPRWSTTGWVVYNNKGKPVRQFEPFFSDRPDYEPDVRAGVSTVLAFDPVERIIATLHPDGSWEKRVVGGWAEAVWDGCDTLGADPRSDPDVGGYVARITEAGRPGWYEQRARGQRGAAEQAAATRALQAAGTPLVSHTDALGRPVLSVATNRRDGVDSVIVTRLRLDIESHTRAVIDGLGRTVLTGDYDMAGRRLYEQQLDSGARWTLPDIGGAPLAAWDDNGHRFRTEYDVLRRPTASRLRGPEVAEPGEEIMLARTVYGEGEPDPERRNLRTQVVQLHDQSGSVVNTEFDFTGALRRSQRRFAADYRGLIDWRAPVELEPESYETRGTFDALNRPTSSTAPDGSVTRPQLNQDGLLDRLEVVRPCGGEPVVVVAAVRYDARGRRTEIRFGNGVRTRYRYDPLSMRLVGVRSTRPRHTARGTRRALLQDLSCGHDPVGNVMYVHDALEPRRFFANTAVGADREFGYDALYRLATATGREQLGPDGTALLPDGRRPRDLRRRDTAALGRYAETYDYDLVGNLLAVVHRSTDRQAPGWRREYAYVEASTVDPGQVANRLSRTRVGDRVEPYGYAGPAGRHGLITSMPSVRRMDWDPFDQLRCVARRDGTAGRGGERTWYVYDGTGSRVRTVTDRDTPAGPVRRRERRYLGGFEQFRRYHADGRVRLARETLTLADDKRRVAGIETRTVGFDRSPERLVRWSLADLCGSIAVEVDEAARLLGYEEYYPFGETSLRREARRVEAPNRYRFSGRERDEESGLYHAGARYLMPWLGRWTAPDPAQLVDGTNRYAYVRNNPLKYSDDTGTNCDPTNQCCSDPTETTAAEEESQTCMPDEHPVENTCEQPEPPPEPAAPPAGTPCPGAPLWDEGLRGERFRRPGYTGPPRAEYTKPYAVAAAANGNYEFAELAENYLCATCHVIARYGHIPDDSEFSMKAYSDNYRHNYAIGQMMVGSAVFGVAAPEVAAVVGAWETGVSTGETITGETSGIHVTNLVTFDFDGGRRMSTGERVFSGVSAGVGWFSMGMSLRTPVPEPLGPPPPGGGGLGVAPANPGAYSVAYETELPPNVWGRSRDVHFNRANAALDRELAANPEFAASMEELIPGARQSVSSVGGRETPSGWTWEHASSTTANGRQGVMRLVPTPQHTPGSPWWRVLHPDRGAAGGYSEWAIPAGAPPNR